MMPTWWGQSSSKDAKKKTTKENFIDALNRFLSPNEQGSCVKPVTPRRRSSDTTSKRSQSRVESKSPSPSTPVSRCQSFADRPHAQALPLPTLHPRITRTPSAVTIPKSLVEKRGKPQLLLPLPKPARLPRRTDAVDTDVDLATGSISSNCSVNSDDPTDPIFHSPLKSADNGSKAATKNISREQSLNISKKSLRGEAVPSNSQLNTQMQALSPKVGASGNRQYNVQVSQHGPFVSAPNSLLSSPSRSPVRTVWPEQIPSAFWSAKSCHDMNFLGSGQCSSQGSGQTSGHNSMGGDLSGQLFWQHSRGSPETSPIPSPRKTSPGPSSRIHSGSVSPRHPRAGSTTIESPSGRHEESKKQSHRLPLPPISISKASPFSLSNSASNIPFSVPWSPGKMDSPVSPGSRWKKGRLLGHGTFGHVYVGFNSDSGEMCAMKEVTLFSDDAKSRESAKQLGQEISLLSRLRHPNIVQYYGCDMIDDKLYIYLEYVSGGSIHKLLQEYGQFGELAIRSYTQQILSGLAYLHAKNTVHRDIKGANILVDPNRRVKLADFGMAKHISGQSCPLSFKGSPYWMAPEVIKNTNGCNLAVDIWSLGCTVLEMATSKPPWSQYEGIAAMFKIGNSKELPAIPDHLSDDGKDFVRRCLQRDPSNRPSAAELLQHPFVRISSVAERSMFYSEQSEQFACASAGHRLQDAGHAWNPSSLSSEGSMIQQHCDSKTSPSSGDLNARNMPGSISPIAIPLPGFHSQQSNGRRSPSPISSPRTPSGSSTPLSGGNDAIPYTQLKQFSCLHEGQMSSPKTQSNAAAPGYMSWDHKFDLHNGMQQGSPTSREQHMIAETSDRSLQFGRLAHSPIQGQQHERQFMLADHFSSHILRDHALSKHSTFTGPYS